MARSSVIYVVLSPTERVLAAFTVKHEMVTWARRTDHVHCSYRRMSDGARAVEDDRMYEIRDLVAVPS